MLLRTVIIHVHIFCAFIRLNLTKYGILREQKKLHLLKIQYTVLSQKVFYIFFTLLFLCLPSCMAKVSLPSSRKMLLFPQLINWAPSINKTPDSILGYFGLGVICPSHFIIKIINLTKIISYKFSLCVNILLPSKVRAQITPQPRDQHDDKLLMHTWGGGGLLEKSMSALVRCSECTAKYDCCL